MRIIDAGETIMVAPATLAALLLTIHTAKDYTDEDVSDAIQDIAASIAGQLGADSILIDAESAWWLSWASDALDTYDLDESADETYEHPAVKAEISLMRQLCDQAPRTTAALDALKDAEIGLMLASRKL